MSGHLNFRNRCLSAWNTSVKYFGYKISCSSTPMILIHQKDDQLYIPLADASPLSVYKYDYFECVDSTMLEDIGGKNRRLSGMAVGGIGGCTRSMEGQQWCVSPEPWKSWEFNELWMTGSLFESAKYQQLCKRWCHLRTPDLNITCHSAIVDAGCKRWTVFT